MNAKELTNAADNNYIHDKIRAKYYGYIPVLAFTKAPSFQQALQCMQRFETEKT